MKGWIIIIRILKYAKQLIYVPTFFKLHSIIYSAPKSHNFRSLNVLYQSLKLRNMVNSNLTFKMLQISTEVANSCLITQKINFLRDCKSLTAHWKELSPCKV